MITKLDYHPKIMQHLSEDHRFFLLSNHDGDYCYLALKFKDHEGMIHLEMLRWSAGVKKSILKDWEGILEYCRNMECKQLVAINKDYQDEKWPKFIAMFGFNDVKTISISGREI